MGNKRIASTYAHSAVHGLLQRHREDSAQEEANGRARNELASYHAFGKW